ncbi:hypothetical protein [Pseudoxanthomonas mexicana]|uniref:hypothetical protein n=1 Tax=Pseudoxanthomonas mexicana TaxID=128785 RepID=UPI00398BA629
MDRAKRAAWCFLLATAALALFAYAKVQVLPGLQGSVTFDGTYYSRIGQFGYQFSGDFEEKQDTAFLPLMGVMIEAARDIIPGDHQLVEVALLGFAILFATLLGIYRLVLSHADANAARVAVALWALSPLGFYNFTGYSDPLYALMCVWVLNFIGEKRFWPASVMAGIALLARPQAAVLIAFVLVALLWARRLEWRRLLATTVPLQIAVMAFPILCLATYYAVAFGDSTVYVHSLEAWRRGSFHDGSLSLLDAVSYFVSAASAESPVLTSWTTLLAMLSVGMGFAVLMFALNGPRLVAAFYVASLAFLFLSASFDAINVARHLFFMVPWAILAGIASARTARTWWHQVLILAPWLLFSATINIASVDRYYRGVWVS